MCQDEFSAAFLAKRAAETAHWAYAILTGLGTIAQAPEDIVQSLSYPDSRPQQSFGEFPDGMRSTFQRENEV